MADASEADPTRRFSNRVEDYVRYRPGYPPEAIALLRRACGLTADAEVADVGSGTGIFSELLLEAGARVVGVEPNPDMRAAAEARLGGNPRFRSVDGRAEATGLDGASVDLVTSAQAFHWFDPAAARREFRRILRPGGSVALVWNDRSDDATPFLTDYDRLLTSYSSEYSEIQRRPRDRDRLAVFFGESGWNEATFANVQVLDWEGLRGRALSSSYVPPAGHPAHDGFVEELRRLFDRHHVDGQVTFVYDTRVFHGPL